MKILQILKKRSSISYIDLPAKEKKKIVKEAIRKANEEQYEMVKTYREGRCHVSD